MMLPSVPTDRYLATGNDNGDLTLWENWIVGGWTMLIQLIIKPGEMSNLSLLVPMVDILLPMDTTEVNTYVNIYNVGTGRVAWQINSGDVYAIAFSPNGEYIALGDDEATITFYRIGPNPLRQVGEITANDDSTMI